MHSAVTFRAFLGVLFFRLSCLVSAPDGFRACHGGKLGLGWVWG